MHVGIYFRAAVSVKSHLVLLTGLTVVLGSMLRVVCKKEGLSAIYTHKMSLQVSYNN
jgi:hypothetical protein